MHAAVSVAVEAFRRNEQKQFAADVASSELTVAAAALGISDATPEDRAEYFDLTTDILAEYEAKRAKVKII